MSDDRTRAAALADEIERNAEFYDFVEVALVPYDMVPEDAHLIVAALRAYAAPQNETAGDDAEIGRSIVAAIGAHVVDPSSPLFEWSPAERYDEVIGDLVEMVVAAREARISPTQDLRERVARAIDDASRVGWRRHYSDEMELRNAGECAEAALSAISAGGYAIVPREPSPAAVARALSTASERCHTDETGLHRTFVPPTTDSMRAALIEYAEKGNG